MSTKIEVILNGVGSITIEHDDEDWTRKQVKEYADEALQKLTALAPDRNAPIGFAAGNGAWLDHGPGDADPTQVSRAVR